MQTLQLLFVPAAELTYRDLCVVDQDPVFLNFAYDGGHFHACIWAGRVLAGVFLTSC